MGLGDDDGRPAVGILLNGRGLFQGLLLQCIRGGGGFGKHFCRLLPGILFHLRSFFSGGVQIFIRRFLGGLNDTGKLQGVRMIFAVLIPMTVGPMIGNAINKAAGNMLENAGADAMTTQYIPAPGIFIAAAGVAALSLIFTAILSRVMKNRSMLHEG